MLGVALGLATPSARATEFAQPEWSAIETAVHHFQDEQLVAGREKDTVARLFESRPSLAVMELVQHSAMLETLPHHVCQAVLDASTAVGRGCLESFGRIMAFDCLINNTDRAPLIWDNDGNARNILVVTPPDDPAAYRLVPIDQGPISERERRNCHDRALLRSCVRPQACSASIPTTSLRGRSTRVTWRASRRWHAQMSTW